MAPRTSAAARERRPQGHSAPDGPWVCCGEDPPHRHCGQPSVASVLQRSRPPSPLCSPQPVDEQLRTRHQGRQGLASRAGATAAGTPAESSSPRQISLPAEFLALCDEAHEDYDPRFSLTGRLWIGSSSSLGSSRRALRSPPPPSKERSVKVAAPAPTARSSRPSTVLKQNSGVTSLRACSPPPPPPLHPPPPHPRPRLPRRRSGDHLRCGGGRPSRRRSRGSTRHAAASVSVRSVGRRRCSRAARGQVTS